MNNSSKFFAWVILLSAHISMLKALIKNTLWCLDPVTLCITQQVLRSAIQRYVLCALRVLCVVAFCISQAVDASFVLTFITAACMSLLSYTTSLLESHRKFFRLFLKGFGIE
jgi:hypothetical protein